MGISCQKAADWADLQRKRVFAHPFLHEVIHAHDRSTHSRRLELPIPGISERFHSIVLLGVDEQVAEGSFLYAAGPADAAVGAFAEILTKNQHNSVGYNGFRSEFRM